jgi:energy-coupling factor transporter ATP-binding protein EcfA2
VSDFVYVEKVSSNVKSSDGLLWEAELGPRTLIVGANGKGKSRIVNAIELALTGRASDLAGRADVAREADLLMLASGRASNLYACAHLNTGETATYAVEYVGAGKARKADHDVPDWLARQELLPVRAVREAMLGSADTACRAFLGWAGKAAERNLADMMSPSLAGALQRLQTLAPMAGVGELESTARKKKLEANATVKAYESISMPVSVLPTEDQLAHAREAAQTARAVLVKAQSAQARAQARVRREQQAQTVALLRKEAQAAVKVQAEWAEFMVTVEAPSGQTAVAKQLLDLLAFTVAGGDGDCLMCGAEPGVEHLRARHAAINAAVGEAMQKANQHAGYAAQARAAQLAMDSAAAKLSYAQDALDAMTDMVGDEGDAVSYADAAAACDAAEEVLRNMQAARAAWGQYKSGLAQLDAARQDAATWKSLEDALSQAGRLLLTDALDDYKRRVQGFLPGTDAFAMRLSEGAREVFQAGFERGGVLHTALSGAEWARLTMAMSAAILPTGAKLAVLTPEERAFDPKTLAAVMKSLSNTPCQVVITSPIAPSGKIPAGWTVVEL